MNQNSTKVTTVLVWFFMNMSLILYFLLRNIHLGLECFLFMLRQFELCTYTFTSFTTQYSYLIIMYWHANENTFFLDMNIRGHRELLDGRLCWPDSEQRPLVGNFTTVGIVKLCCHKFTQIANFMIYFVSTISYRPTDLSLLKEFSKNVSF